MDENEAKKILQGNNVVRDPLDSRSCIEIVKRLGLIPEPEVVNLNIVLSSVSQQVLNMTGCVKPDQSPYFADVSPLEL